MMLLERDSFLGELSESLGRTLEGRGSVVLIGGEAGVGKTALVEAFCAADRRVVRVIRGGCDALLTPRPLGPLFDFARELGDGLGELLGNRAPRELLFGALLEELGAVRPTVAVIEDVHWADEATLDLLRFLARRVRATGSLLLVTHRTDEVLAQEPLRLLLGDLATSPDVRRLHLAPLSPVAVRELAAGTDIDAEALYDATGGNPFFVTEVLAVDAVGVPASVRDAVLARAARLSSPARDALFAAAIVPQRIEDWLLEAIVPGSGAGVDECVRAGLLVREAPWLAFRHELARVALGGATPVGRVRELHERALAALSARADARGDHARLADHAEAARDAKCVLRYAPAAAREAARVHAHREAAAQWARALRFAHALPTKQLAPMLEARSYECYLTDQLGDALEARQRALDCWREVGDVRGQGDCLRWLSRLSWSSGDRARAERYAIEAIALLETLPPGRELAMAYSNRAQLAMLAAQTDDAVMWGERAIDLAERVGDRETLAHALNNVGTAYLLSGAEEGHAALERSLEVSLENGLEDDVVRAFTNLAACAAMTKDPAGAERYIDQALSYCGERDLDSSELHVLGWRALASLDSGRWSEATDAADLVLRRAGANRMPRVDALVALGRVRARRGDPDAQVPLDEALALAAPTGEQRLARVAAARAEAAWLARTGDVAFETDRARNVAREVGNPWEIGELACWRWRAGIREDIPPRAAKPYALEISGEWARAAELWTSRSCPYEAALALAGADDQDALRRALAELQRLGARPAAAIVERRLRERGARGLPRGPYSRARANPAGLTARELEVLTLLVDGLRNAQIAERLVVSQKTVDHHVSAILNKLDARTRGQAAAEAVRLGIVQRTEHPQVQRT
jgi:DNA-binding CsgD family transcriptional regulator/tetratricopeptide (TPR) repeat protein